MTSVDLPICGFGLVDGMCRMPVESGVFCPKHEGIVCEGCGRHTATHQCGRSECLAVLCEACEHISATQHGPRVDPRDVAENEMARTVEMIMEDLNATEVLPSTQVQRRDAASLIVRRLSTHVAMKVLAGMARTERTD
jgi:hypothetical protein